MSSQQLVCVHSMGHFDVFILLMTFLLSLLEQQALFIADF